MQPITSSQLSRRSFVGASAAVMAAAAGLSFLGAPAEVKASQAGTTFVYAIAGDPGSVTNPITTSDRFGLMTLQAIYVELALNKLRASKTAVERIDAQRTVGDYLLTFWGALEDGDSATEVKAFVMAGKYLERLDLFSRFKRDEDAFRSPVVRLDFYLSALPERARGILSGAVGSVADAMALRGYSDSLVDRVRSVAPVPAVDGDGNALVAGTAVES